MKPSRKTIVGAIYARYSSEMQASTSARDQIERIKSLAARHQIDSRMHPGAQVEIAPEWIQSDEAVSGKVAGRRGYQVILEGIRAQAFNLLIVDDLSRLTRSLGDLFELYRLLRHHDVELISISDRVSSADPNAKTLFTVKGMVADFGNEAHSERTLRGLESRARDLFSTGQKPFGYGSEATRIEKRKGKEVKSHFRLFIVEEQARIVREIFDLYAKGYGKSYISKALNQKQAPTPTNRSAGWKDGLIFNILTNEKYIGRWVYRKHWYSVDPDSGRKVPKVRPRDEWVVSIREDLRIISQEIWEKVHRRLEVNKREKRLAVNPKAKIFGNKSSLETRYLLSGAMVCAECGLAIVIVSGRRDGYYGCFGAHRQGTCSCKYLLRRYKAERAFTSYLREKIIENETLVEYCADRYNQLIKSLQKKAPNRKKEIEAEVLDLQSEISNLVRFIAEGKAGDLETISGAIRDREIRKAALIQELETLSASSEPKILITPHLVRNGLSRIVEKMIDQGDRYNEAARAILTGPLKVSKEGKSVFLRGAINIGAALEGSIHCEMALPRGFEPRSMP